MPSPSYPKEKASSKVTLLRVSILVLIALLAFSSRLFSVLRFESVIHEFDPWFNYRTTRKLVTHGFYAFWNWFDERSWYPLGRVVGGTVYPGLMVTAAMLHNGLRAINIPVDVRNICVFLAPLFSGATAFTTYLVTREVQSHAAGLLAALFVGIAPGYISRSVAGSYDNEGIAIFLLMGTYWLWLRAVKTGSAAFAALASLAYFYMVAAWGGYVFITNLIPLHVLALLLMGRYSPRVYIAYSVWYAVGTMYSMQIPFVGFAPVRTSEHMAALGVFGLTQIVAFTHLLRAHTSPSQFRRLLTGLVLSLVIAGSLVLLTLSASGVIAPWTGRFYSLWDTDYAKKYIPIIASVSEHQPTAWPSFLFDLQLLIWLFPAGVYLCFQELRDEHVFIILYSVTASYFAGVMVRLMLTLTPVVCVAAAVAVSRLLDTYMREDHVPERLLLSLDEASTSPSPGSEAASESKKGSTASTTKATSNSKSPRSILGLDTRLLVTANTLYMLVLFVWHCTWVTSNAYSSPSIVLASQLPDGSRHIIDDFREAYYWLQMNTDDDAKIMAWWDYGYQIAGMANRTVIVDNNTWNNTHIATVGRAMAAPEPEAYQIMRRLDVDYVLVIFGGVIGYSGDDLNKFLWMIRIGEGVYPDHVKEGNFFSSRGEYRVDDEASQTMRDSLMYKLSYYRVGELYGGRGYDRVRNQPIQSAPIKLSTLEEAYTSENWIVRIYKVKKPDVLGRDFEDVALFDSGKWSKRKVIKD
ncbi:MAG: glycosyltransferase family 66 protein [Piptocephalis tieghemiana]|nr:MAG: glycosyltransferase family 66 protein [Piptocephalis tieghemiana]